MYIKYSLKSIAFIVFLTISGNAQSAFIDNGLTTIDTLTNLEWLDLTETEPFSYDQVEAELLIGGMFEGYRRATVDELNTMFANFGLATGIANQPHLDFIALFGQTHSQDIFPETFGYAQLPDDSESEPSLFSGLALTYGLDFVGTSPPGWYKVLQGSLGHNTSTNFAGFGSFLVVKTINF
jgi:hypothetical protein